MKYAVLALPLLFAAWSGATAAEDLPYGGSHVFAAFRNGQQIGTHRLSFDKQGDRLVVTASVDLSVKLLGFTAYRYSHRSRETWNGQELQVIDSSTDDDGKHYTLRAQRDAAGLRVERQSPGVTGAIRDVLAPTVLPSTHWNIQQTRQPNLLNSQKGTVDRIGVQIMDREIVRTASGSIDATRYRYTGDVSMDQWFDARGRWVKTAFTASDGSLIEYVLQE